MNKTHIIVFLLCLNVLVAGLFYYMGKHGQTGVGSTNGIETSSWGVELEVQKITLAEAVKSGEHLYDIFHAVELTAEDNVFDNFYSTFSSLDAYEDFKEYTETYPSTLPIIYALKLKDKESYIKYVSFLYDLWFNDRQDRFQDDIADIVNSQSELSPKDAFIAYFEDHYNAVVSNSYSYDGGIDDAPWLVAASADDIDMVKSKCNSWKVTGDSSGSKDECYAYALHYRATQENGYCDELTGNYDKAICVSSFTQTVAQ